MIWILMLVVGCAWRLWFAWNYQSRVWIDEVWVALNPAFRMLTGFGILNPMDWQWEIRSWLPPTLIYSIIKPLHAVGLTGGELNLFMVRLVTGGLTAASAIWFLSKGAEYFRLQAPPILGALFFLFTPEFVRYSTTADLSVLAGPAFLFGLSAYFFEGKIWRGLLLICLAVLIRYQLLIVPLVLGAGALWQRNLKRTAEITLAILLMFAFETALNTVGYGHLVCPLLNYYKVNLIQGLPAIFGVTPFYHGFELLWRFMTEPAFLVAVFTLPLLLKRAPVLAMAIIVLTAAHIQTGHKEFRFFYLPAVLHSILGALVLQQWLERQKQAVPIALFTAALFSGVALWRGTEKVGWSDFEMPSRMETKAGQYPDIKGLIVYGYSGIKQGQHYTFHRALPYAFAENLNALRLMNLDPKSYNYVITTGPENHSPCPLLLESKDGAHLYKCTEGEISALIAPRPN